MTIDAPTIDAPTIDAPTIDAPTVFVVRFISLIILSNHRLKVDFLDVSMKKMKAVRFYDLQF